MVPDFQMPCHQSSHHTTHHYSNTMPRTSAKQAALARSIKRRNILLLLSHRDAAFNDTCLQESQYFPLFAKQASAVQKLRKSRYSTRTILTTPIGGSKKVVRACWCECEHPRFLSKMRRKERDDNGLRRIKGRLGGHFMKSRSHSGHQPKGNKSRWFRKREAKHRGA